MRTAVYSGTRNVYQQMLTAMKSLILHTDMDKIYFLIQDDIFPYELPSYVQCINISNQTWINKNCPNCNPWWGGVMNLIRLALAKVFPEEQKILSLDIDTIVIDDISQLWDLDLTNYYIAGVRDTAKLNAHGLYVNAGVILYNLEKIRNDNIDDRLLQEVQKEKRRFPTQDPLNEVMKGKILELPTEYNSCTAFMNYDANKRKIIHYAGYRAYTNEILVKSYKNIKLDKII